MQLVITNWSREALDGGNEVIMLLLVTIEVTIAGLLHHALLICEVVDGHLDQLVQVSGVVSTGQVKDGVEELPVFLIQVIILKVRQNSNLNSSKHQPKLPVRFNVATDVNILYAQVKAATF